MTRYLRRSGFYFSLAIIVSLLGFVTAFADEPSDQTTADTIKSSEKQEQPKMNQETDAQRNHNSTRSNTAKPQDIVNPSNAKESVVPSDGQQIKAKKVVKFKAGADTNMRQIQPNPKPDEATTVKSSKSNSSE